ncbi:MAG: TSUP family transporter, partial [Gemmatimonadaceae bacterium]
MTPLSHPPLRLALVALAAAGGGAVNAIAGGGTLLTFPALVALGIDPLVANATSTVALWPGTLSSMWGYRDAIRGARAWAVQWAAPSALGGLAGALLLLRTPRDRFANIVPWLVLAATVLFVAQRALFAFTARHKRAAGTGGVIAGSVEGSAGRGTAGAFDTDAPGRPLPPPPAPFLFYQFAVAIY